MGNILGENTPRVKIEERVYQYTRTRRPAQEWSKTIPTPNCQCNNLRLGTHTWLIGQPLVATAAVPGASSSHLNYHRPSLTRDTTIYPMILPPVSNTSSRSSLYEASKQQQQQQHQIPQLVWRSSSKIEPELPRSSRSNSLKSFLP